MRKRKPQEQKLKKKRRTQEKRRKHRKELTKKEIDDALARIETDRKLKEAVYREMNAGSDMRWARSDKFFERVGKVVGYANKGLDVVNTVKKIGDLLPKKEKVTRSMALARKALDNLGDMGYDEVMSTASMIGTVAKIESSSGKHKSKVKYNYDALLNMSRAGSSKKDSGNKKEDDNSNKKEDNSDKKEDNGDKKKEDKNK